MKRWELTAALREAGVADADFEAMELLCHFTGKSRAAILSDGEGADYAAEGLPVAVARRISREPLQYILGEWDFYGFPFGVRPGCLIPRADTELLCSLLIDGLPAGGRFADLCCGSGCIGLAALLTRRDAVGVGVELYPDALACVRDNIRRHALADRYILLADDVKTAILPGSFDWIVSNPPYLAPAEMAFVSPEVEREPASALTDGEDGLSFYRTIFSRYPAFLSPEGVLAVEIGWEQGEAVCAIARANGLVPTVRRDLEGRDRVVLCRRA